MVTGRLLIANKHPGCAEAAQQEIYRWVAEAVALGHSVVRLKIGTRAIPVHRSLN